MKPVTPTTARSARLPRPTRARRLAVWVTLSLAAATLPTSVSAVALQEEGTDGVAVTVSTDATGPHNPSCSVNADPPTPQPQPPGPPTKYVGHASAVCSGSGWANIELYSLIQYSSSGTPGTWQTFTDTQKNAFGTGIVHAYPEIARGRVVGHLRTRGVARFTFEYAVQQHEVRNGCAKPGPYTITCVVYSSSSYTV